MSETKKERGSLARALQSALPSPGPQPVSDSYVCARCEDRGHVLSSGNIATPCSCRDPRQSVSALVALLGQYGLETDEIDSAISSWDTEAQREPQDLFRWCQGLASEPPKVKSWVLFGRNGRGKTKAAAMGAAAYIRAGGKGLYWINIPEITERVMRERVSHKGESPLEGRIKSAKFLVMDELGGEREGIRAEAVEDWILHRYRRRLPMLGTTNAGELDDIGDGRIASRLDQGEQMEMTGHDYRTYRYG